MHCFPVRTATGTAISTWVRIYQRQTFRRLDHRAEALDVGLGLDPPAPSLTVRGQRRTIDDREQVQPVQLQLDTAPLFAAFSSRCFGMISGGCGECEDGRPKKGTNVRALNYRSRSTWHSEPTGPRHQLARR